MVDRCIGGDSDWNDWASCVKALSSLGLHGIENDPPNSFDRRILELNNQDITSGGIYSPPGAEPDTGISANASYMEAWATKQFERFFEAGFNKSEMTTFALADEPGWYFPASSPENLMGTATAAKAAVAKEWLEFLQLNKISAKDFGQSGQPTPSTRRWPQLKSLPDKKLFYWSARFSSWSSTKAFARSTAALEGAMRVGTPIYVK